MSDISSTLPVTDSADGTVGATAPTTATEVAGSDGTNLRVLATDTTGKLNINNVSGTVSLPTGAATSANQTNASQKTQIVDGSGNVIGSTSNALNVDIGSTGTVVANQGTSPWVENVSQFGGSNVVTGTGNSGAGIPRVTVSNDSSITNISGTISLPTGASTSANQTNGNQKTQVVDGSGNIQPSGDVSSRGIFVKPTDGTNTVTVKAASTPAASTDTSLVTSLNPNTPLPTGTNTIGSVTQATASNFNAQVVGNVASGSADSGNPVKVGGVYNSTLPTFSTGQRGDVQLTSRGSLIIAGATAVGVTPIDPPVSVSGVDGSGFKRAILTDSSGRVNVDTYDGSGNPITSTTANAKTRLDTSSGIVDQQTLASTFVTTKRALKAMQGIKLVGDPFEGSVLDGNIWTATVSGTGSNTVANDQLQLTTGATANSQSLVISVHRGRFIPGDTNSFQCNIQLSNTGSANNVRRWGAYNSTDGFFFQLNGTTPGIGSRRSSSDTIVTSFNGPNAFVLDTNFHSYEIQYDEKLVLFFQDNLLIHTLTETSATLTSSIHLYITCENTNSGGGTANVSLFVQSPAIIRYGEVVPRPKYFNPSFLGRVQSATAVTAGNQNSLTCTLSAGSTGGNCIIVAVGIKANAISSITDNQAQTYTLASSLSDGSGGLTYIYYVTNTSPNVTTITVTLTVLTTDSIEIIAAEYSGINTTSPLDKTSTNANATGTAWTSNATATTAQAVELLFGSAYDKAHNSTSTAGSGWTKIAGVSGNNTSMHAQDQIVSATGAYAATGTASQNTNIYASIATFKMTVPAGFLITNVATIIKYGPCNLSRIIINSAGSTGSQLTLYDGTSTSGNVVAVIPLTANTIDLDYDLDLDNGLTVLCNSSTANFTIRYD